MPSDTAAFLARTAAVAATNGCLPRRRHLIIDLPNLPEGSNEIPTDIKHHIDFATVRDDPGLLGAMVQSLERKPDA